MKNILVACDSFKNSMEAKVVGDTITKAFKDIKNNLNIHNLPIADGGEGTVKALVDATGGEFINLKVKDPLGREVDSYLGLSKDKKTAFIEMATASGIELITREERNPMKTSTYGTGQLIKKALDLGVDKIIIGIGGSATNDGGAGMAVALGVKLLDADGKELAPHPEEMQYIAKVDLSGLDKRIKNVEIKAACDVDNPLVGPRGSSATYGPQKGADQKMVSELDNILDKYSSTIPNGNKVALLPGAGAAGGLGFGLAIFCNANLESGFQIISDYLNLEKYIKGCDLLITGEGQMDFQSVQGKGPVEIAKIAKQHGKPVIAFVGSLGERYEEIYEHGITSVYSILRSITNIEKACKCAVENLYGEAFNVAKTLFITDNNE